jgi:uncharacterized membrane protein (DUF2068 family)
MSVNKGLRAIALFEVVKGAVVLAAGFGVLRMLRGDMRLVAESVAHHLQLDPTARVIEWIAGITPRDIWLIVAAGSAYALLRFIEAYGLWHEKAWAEWLAVVSGGLYVPIEMRTLIHHPTWIKASVLLLNVLVVVYLILTLMRSRQTKASR